MNSLAEDALPIWMGGAVLFTLALVVMFHRRTLKSLLFLAAVALLTAALLLFEWWVVTPREAVVQTLHKLASAVERNDLDATLSFLSSSADKLRSDATVLMPRLEIRKARVTGTPIITLNESVEPPTAVAEFRGMIDASDKRTGMRGAYFDDVVLQLTLQGDQWLVDDYFAKQDWRGMAR